MISLLWVSEGTPTLHKFKPRSKKIWWNKNEQDGVERILQINFNVFGLDDAMLRLQRFSNRNLIWPSKNWKSY